MTTRELLVKINGDSSGLNNALIKSGEQLRAVEKNAKAVSASFMDFGKKMTMSVTVPLVALGTAMVKEAADAERATTLLGNAIAAVGNQGSVSVTSLKAYASQLQKVSKYGDDTTVSAFTLLEQMTALKEDGLKALMPSIQNLASALGMDLQNATSLVGKTIGSNVNALGRYGIAVDANASKAEKMEQVLAGLAKYQGAAAAEANTFSGRLMSLKNELSDLAEEFGNILLPILTKIVEKIRKGVEWFTGLSDATKKTILIVAGIAAAIGPATIAIGGLIQTLTVLKGVMLLAGGPAGWITLAAAAFVALGVAIYGSIKAQNDWRSTMSGESKKTATEQIKYLDETIAGLEKYIAKMEKIRDKKGFKYYSDKDKKFVLDEISDNEKLIEQAKEKKAELEKLVGATEKNNEVVGNGIVPLEDLTEAEKKYKETMELASAAIENNRSEEEKLGIQFDALQNLKTTSEEDEKKRLQAMAVLRQQIFDLQMANMEALSDESAAGTPSLEEGIEAAHEYSAELQRMLNNVEPVADALEIFKQKLQGVAEGMSKIIGPAADLAKTLSGGKEEWQEYGAMAEDAVKIITSALEEDWASVAANALSLIDKVIKKIQSVGEKRREARRETESYLDVVASEEGKLLRVLEVMKLMQSHSNVTMEIDFTKLKSFKELSAAYGDDIGKSLAQSIIGGMTKVDFMAAIGKILIEAMMSAALATGPIASAMAAIGEKISYMVINGFSEAGVAEIESMASNLYDTFSSGVLPVVSRVRDIFGIGAASSSASDSESIGSFASGVTNWRGGIARVGEQGPETVRLPRGSSVDPSGTPRGGFSFIFNSPKALSPMETRRNMIAASRQLAFETGGNF